MGSNHLESRPFKTSVSVGRRERTLIECLLLRLPTCWILQIPHFCSTTTLKGRCFYFLFTCEAEKSKGTYPRSPSRQQGQDVKLDLVQLHHLELRLPCTPCLCKSVAALKKPPVRDAVTTNDLIYGELAAKSE